MVVVLFYNTRPSYEKLTEKGENVTGETIGWCILIFSLILGFTIANFYARYIEIRETFVTEVTNLQIISRFIDKNLGKSALLSIKEYAKSVLDDLQYSLANKCYSKRTADLYAKMNTNIQEYLNQNSNFSTAIVNRMSTSQKIKVLVQEIDVGEFYISSIWLLFIFTLIPLYYSHMKNRKVQLILEFFLILIFSTGIYLCTILNNPLSDTPVKLNLSMYQDLIYEIDKKLL